MKSLILLKSKSMLPWVILGSLCTTPLVANTPPPDLDLDGIPNIIDPDVDNDGVLNGRDRNIDGGRARTGPLRNRQIGDLLPNNSPMELDMDADGLLDDSPLETDIDGDGLSDGVKGEFDIDGDGVANGLDGDVDGDGIGNPTDKDLDGTGINEDILFEGNNPSVYVDDTEAAEVIRLVDGELRKRLGLDVKDVGLRVRVLKSPLAGMQCGLWRYFSSDQMQAWANWCYPPNDPSQLNIFVQYQYTGPFSGKTEDYVNPANYRISAENRFYARYPRGPLTFHSWIPGRGGLPGEAVDFFYSVPNQEATGLPPPIAALRAALKSMANFSNEGETFTGDLSPTFTSLMPAIELQRTLFRVTRSANGLAESRRLR
jgi:hypothetical protein